MLFEILTLRLIHVVGGMFWVGSMLFLTLFLVPALAGNGAAFGQVMGGLQRRRLMTYLPVVALLVILTGLRLIWIASSGFANGYLRTPQGGTYAAAGAITIVAFLIGVTVARPAAQRAGQLAASLPGAPEQDREGISRQVARFRQRNATASLVTMVLLLLGSAGMAVARYL